ncbi:MAG: helix-turn-helix domain-containing protein [Lachnospiraceae bacterium]|nr:helix-turn-helix domain-containing protein [Lachnospiraceae bacterium]
MKFNEKLVSIRKKQGLSQEELGMELQVSRQTISKWETGQSYPDFQSLVMLSDYFGMSLDELVKDIDVQDIREKNMTDEKVASIFSDVQKMKDILEKGWKIIGYVGWGILIYVAVCFVLKLLFF